MDNVQLRNFKDFLHTFNKMSEGCFLRCVDNLNSRNLSKEEADCVEICASKHINVNHKVMGVYIDVQSQMYNKKVAEAERQLLAQEQKSEIQAIEQSAAAIETIATPENVNIVNAEESNTTRSDYLATAK